jgi:CheY-like chemotaxis protein
MDPVPIKILLGESDAIVALDLQNQLGKIGYQTESLAARTLNEALLLARERKPDVLVLDFDINGRTKAFETASKISQAVPVPIVFLTAFPAEVHRSQFVSPPAYRYINKPFVLSELQTAIQELLAQTNAQ